MSRTPRTTLAIRRSAKAERPGAYMTIICRELELEVQRLRGLAEHLRHCRECGETDVANCREGEALWDGCMPQPAAEIGVG